MEETKHWENLKSGDVSALQALYDLHAATLYSYGMSLCQDEHRVKDNIHDLFLAFWNNRSGLTIPASGRAYLMVSLRRRIFDKGPKSQITGEEIEEDKLDDHQTADPEQAWILGEEEDELQQKLGKAMASISDRQREIIHMRYFEKMEYEDIARIMGLNYQSARNLVTRALAALRQGMLIILGILLMRI